MSKSKSNRKGGPNPGALFLLVVGAMGAGALAMYVAGGAPMKLPENMQRTERLPEHQKPKPTDIKSELPTSTNHDEKQTSVTVLKPKYDKDGTLKFDKDQKEVQHDENPYVVALNGYLANAKIAPEGSKVVNAELKGDVLVVSFSKQFDRTYGTEDEETLVNGLLTTAGQFPGVKKMLFTIEGQELETLGNVDLTQPISVLRE